MNTKHEPITEMRMLSCFCPECHAATIKSRDGFIACTECDYTMAKAFFVHVPLEEQAVQKLWLELAR